MQLSIYSLILMFVLSSVSQAFVKNDQAENILEQARQLFYESVEEASKIKAARNLFEKLESYPAYQGRAITYLGAIRSLEGKHASWVYTKYNRVKQGLAQMEEGLQLAPEDIESLFIYGTTCYYLPFLFGSNDEAQASFKQLSLLLPEHAQKYDRELVINVIDFLNNHGNLTDQKQKELATLKATLDRK